MKLIKSEKWTGRIDGLDSDSLRWHQIVQHYDVLDLPERSDTWIFTGFVGDEGVRRNQGRTGAKDGPESIRLSASNLPSPKNDFRIIDIGNFVAGHDLETDQVDFGQIIATIHRSGNRSLVLGGGHEITYPHFIGLKTAFPEKKIGIINIDAHYDLRAYDESGVTSGTGFYQILNQFPETGYLILGVNEASNTEVLKKRAHKYGVEQLNLFDLQIMPVEDILYTVRMFAQRYDILYLTVCMDVFSSAFAPGVSAPAAFGLIPDARFFTIFREIHRLNKIHAFDIAEVSPSLDQDSRTSRLAAQLLYYWIT